MKITMLDSNIGNRHSHASSVSNNLNIQPTDQPILKILLNQPTQEYQHSQGNKFFICISCFERRVQHGIRALLVNIIGYGRLSSVVPCDHNWHIELSINTLNQI